MIQTRPVSPYLLLQEIYHPNEWQVILCCIFLNQTRRGQVDKIRDAFFKRWPSPDSVQETDFEEIRESIRSLGFYNRRAKTIIRFSREFMQPWSDISELHGVGQYARDSYSIFFENKIVDNPSDHVLKDYMQWYNTLQTPSSNNVHS